MLKKCHALKGTKAHTSDATTTYAAFSHPQPAAWHTSATTQGNSYHKLRVCQAGLDARQGLAF